MHTVQRVLCRSQISDCSTAQNSSNQALSQCGYQQDNCYHKINYHQNVDQQMTRLHASTMRTMSEISKHVQNYLRQRRPSGLQQTLGSCIQWQLSDLDCGTYNQCNIRYSNHWRVYNVWLSTKLSWMICLICTRYAQANKLNNRNHTVNTSNQSPVQQAVPIGLVLYASYYSLICLLTQDAAVLTLSFYMVSAPLSFNPNKWFIYKNMSTNSYSIIACFGLEGFAYVKFTNCILTMLCCWKVAVPAMINHRVYIYISYYSVCMSE